VERGGGKRRVGYESAAWKGRSGCLEKRMIEGEHDSTILREELMTRYRKGRKGGLLAQ